MAFDGMTLKEEMTTRFERMEERVESMMKLILEILKGSKDSPSGPLSGAAREGGLPATKLKQKAKAEPPKEETVPLPPFGWKTVTRKIRKHDADEKEKDKKKTEEKKIPLKLFQKDWTIKVLSREELVLGVEGVLLTSDEHAAEVLPLLSNQNLKLVLVTPNSVNDKSKKFECRCVAVNDRITKVTRWFTNIGAQSVTPVSLLESNETPKIALTNTTVKIVSQAVKKYSNESDWQAATRNPGEVLRDWISHADAFTSLVHSYRPVHKDNLQGGAQWIEQVVIMKADGAKKLMKASGVKGIFAKRFIGEDQPPATTDWKIVWVGQEMKLKTVLDRGQLLGDDYKGLAHGRNGLGVRVPQNSYRACGNKLLGDAFVPSNDNVQIYEISKVPVWINPEELIIEMTTQMAWVTEFVRVNKTYGAFKSFLVRGSIEPPKDCLLVDDELLLIQPAKPIPKGKYSVSYFSGKVSKDDRRNKSNTKVPTTVPKGQGATQLQVFEGPNPKRRKSV